MPAFTLSSVISPVVILIIVLGVAFALMLSNRARPDVVALSVALVLGVTGVIRADDVFVGLSSSAVITIIGVFMLAQGLQRTGVTRRFGRMLTRINRGGERGMIALVMASSAFLSLFMNNIAAAAVLLPGVVDAVKRLRLTPSKIMLPLAVGTEVGGMATLLTTGNIVVSGALMAAGLPGYGLLDFWQVGVPVTLVAIVFMLTVGRSLLPRRDPANMQLNNGGTGDALTQSYELMQRLNRVRVPETSSLVNVPIAESGIGKEFGLSVMAVLRNGKSLLAPSPQHVIRAGDTLLLIGRRERAEQLIQRGAIVETVPDYAGELTSDDISLVEVMVAPRSRVVGQTLKQVRFREKFGANVLALWHGGRSVRTDLATLPLQLGDSMLVHGSREAISLIQSDSDFLVLRGQADDAPIRAGRAVLALVITALALLAAAANLLPIAVAVMLGALMMIVTQCMTMEEAYRSIEWRAVFLIAGMLPVSQAMINTGLADAIGRVMVNGLAQAGPVAVGAGLLVVTMALTQVMSGQVTAVVLAPIAIAAAQAINSDPRAMAMFVAMGSSLTFITPTAHPVNVFVMGAGGYTAGDYPRVGLPLTLILAILVIVLVALVWKP
jgi:di/tricarboxylate transporter